MVVDEAFRQLNDGDFEKAESGYYRLKNRMEYMEYLEEVAPGMGRFAKLASLVAPEVDARMSRDPEVKNNNEALYTLQYLEPFDLYLTTVRFGKQFDLDEIKRRVWENGAPLQGAASPVERVAAKIILDNLSVRARIYHEVLESFIDRIEKKYNEQKGEMKEDFDPNAIVMQTMAILKRDYEQAPREIKDSPWGSQRLDGGYRERINYLKGFSGEGQDEFQIRQEMQRIIEDFRKFIAEIALGVSLYQEMQTLNLATHFYGGPSSRVETEEVLLGDAFRIGISAAVQPSRALMKWKVFYYLFSKKSGDFKMLGSVSLRSSAFDSGGKGLWAIEAPEEKTFLNVDPKHLGEEFDEEGDCELVSVLSFGDWKDPMREVGYTVLTRPIDYASLFSKDHAAFVSPPSGLSLVKPALMVKAPRFIYRNDAPLAEVWLKVPDYAIDYEGRAESSVWGTTGKGKPELVPEKIEKLSTNGKKPSTIKIVFSGKGSEEGAYLMEVAAEIPILAKNEQHLVQTLTFEYSKDANPQTSADTAGANDVSGILKELERTAAEAEKLAADALKTCNEANAEAAALQKAGEESKASLAALGAQGQSVEAEMAKVRQLLQDVTALHSEVEQESTRVGEAAHKMEALSLEICEGAKAVKEGKSRKETERIFRDIEGKQASLDGWMKKGDEAVSGAKKAAENAHQRYNELSTGLAAVDEWKKADTGPEGADALGGKLTELDGKIASAREKIGRLEELRGRADELLEKLRKSLETADKGRKDKALAAGEQSMNRIDEVVDLVKECPDAARSKVESIVSLLKDLQADLSKIKESRQILLRNLGADRDSLAAQAREKIEMTDYVLELAMGYFERLRAAKGDADVCRTLAQEGLNSARTVATPNVKGLTLEQASGLIRQNGLNVDARTVGAAQRPDLEYIVASQNPAAGTQVQPGSTVVITHHGSFDPARVVDCSRFPGTFPTWDEERRQVVCMCLTGLFPSADNTGCIDCNEYWNSFYGALMRGDVATGEQYYRQAVNCPWNAYGAQLLADARHLLQNAEQERARIDDANRQQMECMQLENDILAAINAGDLQRANNLLAYAESRQCVIGQLTRQIWENELDLRRRQAQNTGMAEESIRSMNEILARMQQPVQPQPQPSPQPSRSSSGQGSFQGVLSGGLDPNDKAALIAKHRPAQVNFESSAAAVNLYPDGSAELQGPIQCTITLTENRPSGNIASYTYTYTVTLTPNGRGSGRTVRALRQVDHVFDFIERNGKRGRKNHVGKPTPVQGALSQQGGVWKLGIPNGNGGSVEAVSYLLR